MIVTLSRCPSRYLHAHLNIDTNSSPVLIFCFEYIDVFFNILVILFLLFWGPVVALTSISPFWSSFSVFLEKNIFWRSWIRTIGIFTFRVILDPTNLLFFNFLLPSFYYTIINSVIFLLILSWGRNSAIFTRRALMIDFHSLSHLLVQDCGLRIEVVQIIEVILKMKRKGWKIAIFHRLRLPLKCYDDRVIISFCKSWIFHLVVSQIIIIKLKLRLCI